MHASLMNVSYDRPNRKVKVKETGSEEFQSE